MAKGSYTIKNRDLVNLYNAVANFMTLVTQVDRKLHYAVSLCKKDIEEKYDAYDEARMAYCKEYAVKDAKGDPKTKPIMGADGKQIVRGGVPATEFDFGDQLEEFKKATDDLKDTEIQIDRYQVSFEELKYDYVPGFIPFSDDFMLFFVKTPTEFA
jgi:hypothetical protein